MSTAEIQLSQSPIRKGYDLTLLNGNYSFAHGLKKLEYVQIEVQPKGNLNFIQHAFEDNGGAFTDHSDDAWDVGDNDVNLLPATPAAEDAFYFGSQEKFNRIVMEDGTDGVGTWTIVWEYWDGDSWETLTVATPSNTTIDFTDISGEIYWTAPSDWQKHLVNSVFAYWVRARVSVYSAITTRPQAKTVKVEQDNGNRWSRSDRLLETFFKGGDAIAEINISRLGDVLLTEHKVDGNVSVGTVLAGADMPFDGEITRVEVTFATNGVTTDNVVDVNVAGTTIFTNQANRPTNDHDGVDGVTVIARIIEAGTFSQDDRITIDIDAVATGTAPTDIHVAVYGRYKPYQPDIGRVSKVRLSSTIAGVDDLTSLQFCRVYDDSAAAFVDEDAAAKESTDNDVELWVSPPTAGDLVYYGLPVMFNEITHVAGTDADTLVGTVVWQYYNGTEWTTLNTSAVSNDYSDLSDPISFEIPSDWTITTIDSQAAYWIRSNLTAFTSITAEPQAGSIQLGISAIVDVNVAGTTIFTTQGYRAALHNNTLAGLYETLSGFKTAYGIPNAIGIDNGRFTKDQLISADIDYAAPATGTEPTDLTVEVWGSYDEIGPKEQMEWKDVSGRFTLWSDNLKSDSRIRVILGGY